MTKETGWKGIAGQMHNASQYRRLETERRKASLFEIAVCVVAFVAHIVLFAWLVSQYLT